MGPTKKGCPLHPGHAKVPWQGHDACVGALVWHAKRARWCLGMGKPSALVPWHGQANARWCLGMGRPSARLPWHGQAKHVGALARAGKARTLVPWHGQAKHVGALAWAGRVRILALAVQRWPSEKEKKKVARNFLKFCVVVYIIILSIAGKNRFKILENEAFRGGGDN